MDGLDGLAASEGTFVGLGGAAVVLTHAWGLDARLVNRGFDAVFLGIAGSCLVLAGACRGFLYWNWAPAKVFMGDVGSGFIGFVIAILAYASARADADLLWPWLILVAAVVSDAGLTLLTRFATRQKWFDAHRSHAYQKAAIRLKSHRKVTLTVTGINALWLMPLALTATWAPAWAPWLTAVAYAPLIALVLAFRAGVPETPGTKPGTVAE
jgi:Fuc2NAc and GlcNAc transferase